MPSQIVDYKCPNCMGPLRFDGASGKLECDYCGSSYSVAEIEAMYAEQVRAAAHTEQARGDWDMSGISDDWGGDNMKVYICPSCGAELLCDATTAATSCPYCGNQTVVPGQFSGILKPDCIIPFRLSREDAKTVLKNYYKGKMFLPRAFSSNNRINEIQGVYVPFWMFDGLADVSADFEAARSRTYQEGDYQVTETKHYAVQRAGTVAFEGIPADASEKMPDAYMDAIEPFDYSELRPFSAAYLPGFLADKYDVSAESCAERASKRAEKTALNAMQSDVKGYSTCTMRRHDVRLQQGKVRYALLPVYMLHTKWEGKDYLFAMNGQTGKLIGDLPVSRKKYWAWFCCIAAVLTAVLGTVLSQFM